MAFSDTIRTYLAGRASNPDLRITPFGLVEEAAAAEAIWPGRVIVRDVSRGPVVTGGPVPGLGSEPLAWSAVTNWLKQNGFGIRRLGLDQATSGLDSRQFDAAGAPGWVTQPFSVFTLPLAADYSNAQAQIQSLFSARIVPLDVIPSDVSSAIFRLYDAGFMPYPKERSAAWADTVDKQQVWGKIIDGVKPMISAFDRGNLNAAANETAAANADAAFWDTVHRVTVAVATLGLSELAPIVKEKWDEMIARLKLYKATRQKALDEAANPNTDPARAQLLTDKVAELDASIGGKIAEMTAQIPGLKEVINDEGLGNPIAILAGLGTAAQIAILVGIIAAVTAAIAALNSLGVFAAIGAAASAANAVKNIIGAPAFGAVILAIGGYIVYRKFIAKKT